MIAKSLAAEATREIERLLGGDATQTLGDFEAAETAVRTAVLAVAARFVAERLNADHSDQHAAGLPCRCGHTARYAGRRAKTIRTALGAMTIERAYYHCASCRTGFCPRDRTLGIDETTLSPAATRMTAAAAARVSFKEASTLLDELAGLAVDPKQVERTAEALGRAIATDERQAVEPEAHRVKPTLYLGMDGTGILVRKAETAQRQGKQPDGSAKTREVKLAVAWTAERRHPKTGIAMRDPDSVSYTAAIETAASRDTDREPSPFAQRVCREAERRRFADAERRVILGDGAPWIWALADECFPDAIQIVDIFNASTISSATASACAIPRSGPGACASPPASSRLAANMPSGRASSAPACTGPSTAPMPSSPCAAASSADASKPSGNDETPLHETAPHKSDVHPCDSAARRRHGFTGVPRLAAGDARGGTGIPATWAVARVARRKRVSRLEQGGRTSIGGRVAPRRHLTRSQEIGHPCRQARGYSAEASRSVTSPLLPRSTIGRSSTVGGARSDGSPPSRIARWFSHAASNPNSQPRWNTNNASTWPIPSRASPTAPSPASPACSTP